MAGQTGLLVRHPERVHAGRAYCAGAARRRALSRRPADASRFQPTREL